MRERARPELAHRLAAEAVGTALLLGGARLVNPLAPGAALVALILMFEPISGAHVAGPGVEGAP